MRKNGHISAWSIFFAPFSKIRFREGKLLQNQKGFTTMKKTSYEAIYATLTSINYDNAEVMDDLRKEINRGAEAKAKKANEYDAAKEVVFNTLRLAGKPVTVAEIFEDCQSNLPEGFTKARVQYGLTHQWADEVVKTEGKVNSYSLRA